MSLLPSAALLALIVERAMPVRSWPRGLTSFAAILGMHVLWGPVFRGFPDVIGVAIGCLVLLTYFKEAPEQHRVLRLIAVGFLLCLMVVARRYYIFWAASFFPAAMLAFVVSKRKGDLSWGLTFKVARNLALAGIMCGAFLMMFSAPKMLRIATTNYAAAYAAYRADLTGSGVVGQAIDYLGVSLLMLCIGGLIWLTMRPASRALGVLVIGQAVLTFALFTQTQSLLGPQHYYLLMPAAGIGVAAAVSAVWSVKLQPAWRVAGVTLIMSVIGLNSVAAFTNTKPLARPLITHAALAPLVRTDFGELTRLLRTLAVLRPRQVYVAASSDVLNSDIVQNGCAALVLPFCGAVARTQDIDMRDGFPIAVLDADYVVLATPTQYHVRPDDQLVVGLVARDVREGRGIGAAFERLAGEFLLGGGTKAVIYRKVKAIPPEAVSALSHDLKLRYPGTAELFEPPASPPAI